MINMTYLEFWLTIGLFVLLSSYISWKKAWYDFAKFIHTTQENAREQGENNE